MVVVGGGGQGEANCISLHFFFDVCLQMTGALH